MRKHANNPVNWYSWTEEALRRAKNDNKPVFLSIGYSSCHWCTVMSRESFENPEIAAIINKNFIPIKVDREERPELDAYYMSAVQSMTGSGGWPLNVFLTPDLKPFYGGTYFPPEPRFGMASFRQVLEFVAQVWKDKRGEIVENADQIAKALTMDVRGKDSKELTLANLDDGYAAMVSSFDQEHGGFGGAPKFPLPLASSFLLRYHYRTGKELALRSVTKTLDEMAAGGIHDHLGGGFHRYSTDKVWLVPHFEKMLYDNALLARVYTEAYQVTGKEEYARTVEDIFGWLMKEMKDKGGGFYSAQDADTEEGEGLYYTWTPAEVEEVLGAADGGEFCRVYGVTNSGNFEGRSILHLKVSEEVGSEKVRGWRSKLYEARIMRPRPATDDKILTSWNGLAISALAYAGAALSRPEYLKAASEAAEFVLSNCAKEGRLLRRYAGGEAKLEGTLEDYTFFIQGLLDLFEATSEPGWLQEAKGLAKVMVDDFEDKEKGGFFLTVDAQPARLKEGYDGVTPSGNSVAMVDLVRLSELTGDGETRRAAERALRFFSSDVEQQPTAHANMLVVLDLLLNGMKEVVVTSRTLAGAATLLAEVRRPFLPDKVVLTATEENHERLEGLTTLLEGRKVGAKARAYVCQNFTCKLPADTAEGLRAQLIPK
ncbi:MAG: thioredoxin domain-containing protein [Thaumarchaeota archaeon]|nr:thioredoxin domain-containing protein [Nitrososphaerota archaeon]